MESLKLEVVVKWDRGSLELQKSQPCLICWVETTSWTKSTSFGSSTRSNIPKFEKYGNKPPALGWLKSFGGIKGPKMGT